MRDLRKQLKEDIAFYMNQDSGNFELKSKEVKSGFVCLTFEPCNLAENCGLVKLPPKPEEFGDLLEVGELIYINKEDLS